MVIFANRQPKVLPKFNLGDLAVEVASGYTYLGVYFKNGNLSESIVKLKNQATRAMYSSCGIYQVEDVITYLYSW